MHPLVEAEADLYCSFQLFSTSLLFGYHTLLPVEITQELCGSQHWANWVISLLFLLSFHSAVFRSTVLSSLLTQFGLIHNSQLGFCDWQHKGHQSATRPSHSWHHLCTRLSCLGFCSLGEMVCEDLGSERLNLSFQLIPPAVLKWILTHINQFCLRTALEPAHKGDVIRINFLFFCKLHTKLFL